MNDAATFTIDFMDDLPPVNWMWPLPKGGADPICPWCQTRHAPTCGTEATSGHR